MPKERRSRSASVDRPSPFPSPSSKNPKSPTSPHHSSSGESLQYDEIRCPVCMDHPHNAVLLLCSSHDKGCRPFLCDTSYRHSNCLDQYRRSAPRPSALSCPLCRGPVSGSQVLPPARRHMDSKPRSCSTESCPFLGTYGELRKHARTDHPLARPSDADPERERDWRTLERQRDVGDLISSLQSGFGEEDGAGTGDLLPFSAISFYMILRFRRSGGAINNGVGRSRNWRRGRLLWGESIVEAEDGVDDENGDVNGDDDDGDGGNNDDGGGEEVNGSSRWRNS